MSEIKTGALERVLSWIDNADLADADDIYGYCRKCHAEIAHKEGCDLPIARAELTALRAQVAQGEADSKRLDWLEQQDVQIGRTTMATVQTDHEGNHGEIELWAIAREDRSDVAAAAWVTVHRETIREAIDAAMKESSHA